MKRMKHGSIRIGAIACVIAIAFASVGTLSIGAQTSAAATKVFVDSAGRTVNIPATIARIAPSGALAQIVLYSIVPDRLIGWSSTPSDIVKKYLPSKYWNLPTFGQFYGRNVSLNLEALIAAKPDIIIDIGEAKKTVREDMDAIQAQTGIPVIFIEATLNTFPKAYQTLGALLGEMQAADALAKFCASAVHDAKTVAATIPDAQKVKIYYSEGRTGLQANASGAIHADIVELIGAKNVAVLGAVAGSNVNQVTVEQILNWQPDIIILDPGEAYGIVRKDPVWKDVIAVKNNRVYQVPEGPYNWMGRPPAINRLIGIYWLGNIVYPDKFKIDLGAKAKEFYALFYHYTISDAELRNLLAGSRQ